MDMPDIHRIVNRNPDIVVVGAVTAVDTMLDTEGILAVVSREADLGDMPITPVDRFTLAMYSISRCSCR